MSQSDADAKKPALSPRDPRIVKHIRAIAEAGANIEQFARALQAFRDDAALSAAQREAVFKTLAQDAAHAYYVMVTGAPIDFKKLDEDMKKSSS